MTDLLLKFVIVNPAERLAPEEVRLDDTSGSFDLSSPFPDRLSRLLFSILATPSCSVAGVLVTQGGQLSSFSYSSDGPAYRFGIISI